MAITDKYIANETFWLNIAAENIYSSFEKRAASVSYLKKVIEWAFAIFTTTGFVGGTFGVSINGFSIISLVCFGFAFSFLVFAYVLAGKAQYPVAKTYHPNDVADISKAFGQAVTEQTKQFKIASKVTIWGFLFLAFGVLFMFWHANQPPCKPKEVMINPLILKAGIEKRNDSVFIPVTAMAAKDTSLKDTNNIITLYISVIRKEKDSIICNKPYKLDTAGHFFYSYLVPDSVKACDTFIVKVGVSSVIGNVTTERFNSVKVIKK
jgi:hypothetical protein